MRLLTLPCHQPWALRVALHGAAAHHLAVLLDKQVGVVRGEDGGVRARQALEGVEAVLSEHGVGWSPPVPARRDVMGAFSL